MPVDGTPPATGSTVVKGSQGDVSAALGFKPSKKTKKLQKIAASAAKNRAADRANRTPPANNLG